MTKNNFNIDIDKMTKTKSHNYYIIITEHHYRDFNQRRCIGKTYEDCNKALQRCEKECDEFKKMVDIITEKFDNECTGIKQEKLYNSNGFKIEISLYDSSKYIFVAKTIKMEDTIE